MDLQWPRGDIRKIIADALHASLSEAMTPSITHIGPINTIGCFLLKHLTGVNAEPVAGSIEVRCGGVPFGLEAHVENVEDHMYYVWIEADLGDQGVELIDFGSRYWREWAGEQFALWGGAPPPTVVWAQKAEIPPSVVEYTQNEEITYLVREGIHRVIVEQEDESCVTVWEQVINSTIDHLMENDTGLQYLVDIGIAEPVEEDDLPG
ncbi:MAG: hypothetical protein K1Y02_18975 [Candidatus Hydrogenedentes bacterium]|nr:hypothetical protein [Candidatus Hydrogenedentota bacterium]